MNRRSFFKETTAAAVGLGLGAQSLAQSAPKKITSPLRVAATLSDQNVRFYANALTQSLKVVHIADTHLFRDDARGAPFRRYSARMAKAYNQTTHAKTGESTHPEEAFVQTLQLAREAKADLITLVGDIFSFPSEAAIEWVQAQLDATGIPYLYTAGNHDWHYEGMEGPLETLRDRWIEKRLLPLYQGNNPLMASYDVKGIRFLAIDNSTYQINAAQLAFFKKHAASGVPLVLLIHIPLYAPGKGIYYGCGHPDWGAATDSNYQLEQRPQWPKNGHSPTTFAFHQAVVNAPNLLGVFAGHIHQQGIEILNGKPQIVSDDNASGGYLAIDFLPLAEKNSPLLS